MSSTALPLPRFGLLPLAICAAVFAAALASGCGDSSTSPPDGEGTNTDTSDAAAYDVGASPGLSDAGDASDAADVEADCAAVDSFPGAAALDSAEDGTSTDVPSTAEDDGPLAQIGEVAALSGESDAASDDAGRERLDGNDHDVGSANVDQGSTVPVAPVVNGTTYTFTVRDQVLAVDAAKGARVVTFSLAGRNILTAAATAQDNNWGSTFWPSPQSAWNWPPPAEIDPDAFAVSKTSTRLTLTGATSATLGLSASKTFSVDGTSGTVAINYSLTNHGTKARSVAPWEITRVAAGGLTFFPMGDGVPSKGSQDLLALRILDGVAWFAYDEKTISSDQKVYADGHEGWIAHVTDDLLLVKVFGDTAATQAAPGEAEIEIFTDSAHTYIEVEDQGAYLSLAPGATNAWTVRWFLLQLDPAISVGVGSTELLSTVRTLIKG
jgi:hypothetical protein